MAKKSATKSIKSSEKVVGRLSLYRRLLLRFQVDQLNIYSHELATLAGVSAAQVRRDIMTIGYEGSPNKGYNRQHLIESIGSYLDDPHGQRLALVGVGHLGRAALNYFSGKRPNLTIAAAFDSDPGRTGRVIHGTRCYPIESMVDVVREKDITVGIIAVPANAANDVAEKLVEGGVRGIVNFAPVSLNVPENVYVTDLDITTTFETTAYFARKMDSI